MKICFFILFAFTFQLMATNTHAQNAVIELKSNSITVSQLVNEIEKQTDYLVVYSNREVNTSRKVKLKSKSGKVSDLINETFNGTDIGYTFENNYIVLSKHSSDKNVMETINALKVQQQGKTVTGTVVDSKGEPVIGATIIVQGDATKGTITDIDGNFTLPNVPDNAVLQITYVGMQPQTVSLNGKTFINITMAEDTELLDEVVVVGYGVQRRQTLTGAVSAISADDIITTKNENVQNLITGKIPGVRVMQRTAEPGAFNNSFDIRGMGAPLIIIDGIPRSNADFQRLDGNDIESISVLKDASAAIYGVRAANGVVLVTTKGGKTQENEMTYSGTYTWQIPSGLPATVDAIGYMTLRNELAMHNLNEPQPLFTEADFESYRTGEKKSTDWYPHVFASHALQTMHNLSATGGNERIRYYASLGYQFQNGFFKSNDLNYQKYNIRSNITAKISSELTFDANLSFIMDEQNRPYQDSWWIIRGFWRQGPHIPVYANNDPSRLYHGEIEGDNPVSFMNKDVVGSRKYNTKWMQPSISLTYDFSKIKGLTAKALLSYDYSILDGTVYQKQYNQYRYDEASGSYQTFSRQRNNISRANDMKSQLLSQTSLNYEKTFVEFHKTKALVVWETQHREGDNFEGSRDLIFQMPYLFAGTSLNQIGQMSTSDNRLYEYTNLALAGRFNYDYAGKYLFEFLFRYDGSSRFSKKQRWGFFPGVSAGWVISEENFFKNSFLVDIDQLKLRASYGEAGDDSALAYQYLSGYTYASGGDRRNFTQGYVFNETFYGSAVNKGIPNPNLTWFTSKTFDIGIDLTAWNGKLGISADYFSRIRDGLLARKTGGIPTVVGAALPEENLNSDQTYGVDMEIFHKYRVNEFYYGLKGLFSITRIKRLHVETAPFGSSWENWKNNQNNRIQGMHKGYNVLGQFESWDQIWNHSAYIGRGTIIGDFIYEDWNGDGEINGNDEYPIRYNQVPWVNFSLIGDANYKGFDLNFLFQGSALGSVEYGEQLRQPLWGNSNSGAMVQFMNRWHPADPTADPYDPSITWVPGHFAYTGTLPTSSSSFNVENGAYIRLKSLELGYTLPQKLISLIGVSNLRVYANAYNIFTITKVKFIDPEHPADTYGYLYPLNKTLSLGLNITF